MSIFLTLTFSITTSFLSTTKSQSCWPQQPPGSCQGQLLYPEMYYDYRTCSTVFDWSRAVSASCQKRFVKYEVEVTNNCTEMTKNVTELNMVLDFIPGSCLANSDEGSDSMCYARVRGQLSAGNPNLSWSNDGRWTGLSNEYSTFQACIVEGHDICLPLQTCGRSKDPPLLIINNELLCPQETSMFNITSGKICFKNVTHKMDFIQMCSVQLPLLCGQPNEKAFIVIKSGHIDVTADHCFSCFDQCGLEPITNTSLNTQNHCVETNWRMLNNLSNSGLRNVCLSSRQPQSIATTSATYYLQLTSRANRAPLSCQTFSNSKTQITKYPELSLTERKRSGIILCDTGQRNEDSMMNTNISDASKTQCKAISNNGGIKSRSFVTHVHSMHYLVALFTLIIAL